MKLKNAAGDRLLSKQIQSDKNVIFDLLIKKFSFKMEEHDFVGCISCMNTNDLYNLFATYTDNVETYAKMFETCFELKVIISF